MRGKKDRSQGPARRQTNGFAENVAESFEFYWNFPRVASHRVDKFHAIHQRAAQDAQPKVIECCPSHTTIEFSRTFPLDKRSRQLLR